MVSEFFTDVPRPIEYEGPDSTNPYAYKVYQPGRLVLGKRMEDHLRVAVCYWHSFK
jgi:xylose isomerase